MNAVDLFLCFVVVVSLWIGWQKGFITGVIDLISWMGSLLIAFLFYSYFASLLGNYTGLTIWTKPVAFFSLLILSRVFISFIFNRILWNVEPEAHTSKVNKAFGLMPGFVNGLINAAIVAALVLLIPFSPTLSATAQDSVAADKLAKPLQWFDALLSPIFDEALKPAVNNRSIYPDPEETVTLPFTVANASPEAGLEREMIDLVNTERAKVGLHSLHYDASLVPVARSHSKDMFVRGYFSHYSLEGKTVSDRLKKAGVNYLSAGENLALAPTLNSAHTGLMKSPGHRANILHKAYKRIGIGILDGGFRGLMITQVFKN